MQLPLSWLLKAVVRDAAGRPVRNQELIWISDDLKTANFPNPEIGELKTISKGTCTVRAKVKGYAVESDPVTIDVWNVDHVLLTPRDLQIPIGTWRELVAEVQVYQLERVIRIAAGCGHACGFKSLLSIIRRLPDQPALWQDPIDFIHNIWWLNLESADAAFAFTQREKEPQVWRCFHANVTVEMVVQVLMLQEYTNKKEGEQPTASAEHRAALDRLRIQLVPQMWDKLKEYVCLGGGLEQ